MMRPKYSTCQEGSITATLNKQDCLQIHTVKTTSKLTPVRGNIVNHKRSTALVQSVRNSFVFGCLFGCFLCVLLWGGGLNLWRQPCPWFMYVYIIYNMYNLISLTVPVTLT